MDKWLAGPGRYLRPLMVTIMFTVCLISGCGHSSEGASARPAFDEANMLFARGHYEQALARYEKLIEQKPGTADRVLFEMGIVYAYPGYDRKDYQKALECFRKIIQDYPESHYRRDSQMLVQQIQHVNIKDNLIAEQQKQIDAYRSRVNTQKNEIDAMQQKIEILQQKVFERRTEPVDKVLIEKEKRRLTLISNGEAVKTYKIALGQNPVGPKEREGDNKTPEGIYTITSRYRNSEYHLSLHISYPGRKDLKRAKELGVSPGGDIMIHGLKKNLAWVGDFHTQIDWTEGCIAVTNQEMEEIARLVPNGTPVEIRP
jgi:L,D-peptidoglycan transpeptidase YkuD (ErfK/YbiS/YcfS/YnhG family)